MMTALLLALLSVSPQDDALLRSFLDGKADAGVDLRERGTLALPALLEAREKGTDKAKHLALTRLFCGSCLFPDADSDGANAMSTLQRKRTTYEARDSSVRAALEHLIAFTSLNLVWDPAVADRLSKGIDLDVKSATLLELLDEVAFKGSLDFDWRYGVVWVSRPDRLWMKPAALTAEQAKAAREWIPKLASQPEKALSELLALGGGVVPIVMEQSADPALARDCKEFLDGARRRKELFSPVPLVNRWTRRPLEKENEPTAAKLPKIRVSMICDAWTLEEVLLFLRDVSGLNVVIDPAVDARQIVTMRITEMTYSDVLPLVTLPRGLDVDLRGGALVITDSKRPARAAENAWRTQKLEGADRKLAEALAAAKVDLKADEGMKLSAILAALKESTKIDFRLEKGAPDPAVTLVVGEAPLQNVLEWLTLPRGLDARIESGAVTLFERNK